MRKGEGSNLQSLILFYTIIQRKALRLDSFPLLPRAWLIRTDRIIPWAWLLCSLQNKERQCCVRSWFLIPLLCWHWSPYQLSVASPYLRSVFPTRSGFPRRVIFFIRLPSRTRSGSGTGTSSSLKNQWDMVSFHQSPNIDSTGSKGWTSEPFLAFHLISQRCCAFLAEGCPLMTSYPYHTADWADVQTQDWIIEKESVERICAWRQLRSLFWKGTRPVNNSDWTVWLAICFTHSILC